MFCLSTFIVSADFTHRGFEIPPSPPEIAQCPLGDLAFKVHNLIALLIDDPEASLLIHAQVVQLKVHATDRAKLMLMELEAGIGKVDKIGA